MQQGEFLNLALVYSPKFELALSRRDGVRTFRLFGEIVTAFDQLRPSRDEVTCEVTRTGGQKLGTTYLFAKSLLATHGQDRKVLLISMKKGAVESPCHLIGSITEFPGEPQLVLVSGALESVDLVAPLIRNRKPDMIFIEISGLILPRLVAEVEAFELLHAVIIRALQIALNQNIPIYLSVQYDGERGEFQDGGLRKTACTGSVEEIASIVISISKGQPPDKLTACILDIVKNRAALPTTNDAQQCQRRFVFRGRFRNLRGAHWRLVRK